MKQRAGSVFRAESARHTLRFTCEHCTYFAAQDDGCSHGYPNAAHREALFSAQAGQATEVELIFCKDFELL